MPLQRIRLTVAYDGTGFYGFQRQRKLPTVQDELEKAISRVTGESISVIAAGRTDAGVHALAQVVHFETAWAGPVEKLPFAIGVRLDPAIAVLEARAVPLEFHARFSARFRRYGYLFHCGGRPDPLRERFALRVPPSLDFSRMMEASQSLVGKRDFGGFASDMGTDCSHSTVREVQRIRWLVKSRYCLLLIQADGFLRHMVRNIVGSLLKLGRGAMSYDQWRCLVENGERGCEYVPAPAAGLCLLRVGY